MLCSIYVDAHSFLHITKRPDIPPQACHFRTVGSLVSRPFWSLLVIYVIVLEKVPFLALALTADCDCFISVVYCRYWTLVFLRAFSSRLAQLRFPKYAELLVSSSALISRPHHAGLSEQRFCCPDKLLVGQQEIWTFIRSCPSGFSRLF